MDQGKMSIGHLPDVVARIEAALARHRRPARQPFVLGIAGAQGSGKSTVAGVLAERHRCPVLSLDDLYLDGAKRTALAKRVHPLFRTRGVPGTHDVALGLRTIDALGKPGTTALPRFDKARDEPVTPEATAGAADLLIFEGWCLGARPQGPAALGRPINDLEARDDRDGTWHRTPASE